MWKAGSYLDNNGACLPGGHCLDHYPNALSFTHVTATISLVAIVCTTVLMPYILVK